MHMILYCFCRR